MAILIAQNSNGNNYTFGSPNDNNIFVGLNNQAETINFSGAGNLKIFDVSPGDTLNLLGIVVSSGNPVNISVSGNIVRLVAGASTYTLGSFNSGESTIINFANQSITITATTTNSVTTYSYTSLEPGSTSRNISATPTAIIFDNTAPIVATIAISGATGVSNGYLNAGDVVSVTVPFSEAVTVTGTPTLDLVINATTVQATYDATTSTANSLIFKYTILDGQNDTGGISIPENALKQVGTSTIKDAAGNNATLTTVLVLDNASYKVDTNAPTVTISTPETTNDRTPVIGGTAEAGSTVTVSVNSKTYTTLADVTTGSWAVGVTTPFAIGNNTYDVSVTAIDPAGNSSTQATQNLIIDTGAKATATPIEKTGNTVLANGVNAVEAVGNIVITAGLANTGAKAGDTIELLLNGVSIDSDAVTSGVQPLTHTLIASEITATSYDFTIAGSLLGGDGTKLLSTKVSTFNTIPSSPLNFVVDTAVPTVTVSSSDTALKIGDTSVVTFTFSEAVTGFTSANITVGNNGTITGPASADGGITWTATLTPSADRTATTNVVSVDKTGVTDLAGNAGVGTTASANYTIDTAVPTVTVSSSDTALKIGDTSVVTFTFSEAVTGFTSADITVGNGTITGPLSSDGITWSATLTPTANITSLTNVISVNQTGVTDLAGNAGVGTTASANYTIDTQAPSTPTLTEVTSKILDGYLNANEATSTTFKLTLPLTGSLAVAGDTVEILSNNLAFSTPKAVVLVGDDITAGYVNVDISSAELGSDGSKSLTAKIIDVAGNVGAASSALAFVLDTTAPTAPTTVLLSPVGGNVVANTLNNTNTSLTATASITAGQATGGSAVLKINGTIVATDAFIAPNDITVTFSVGNATTIETGGPATVEITDLAGNTTVSSASNPTLTVNRTSSTLAASVPSISVDNGSSATDLKTNQAVQTITSTLSRALSGEVLYGSTNNGDTWTDITSKVSTTALNWDGAVLAVGSNNIRLKVKVSTTGNETLLNTAGYTLDTVAPIHAPTFALLTDSGVLSSDGISSTGTLTVTAPTGGFETNARWDYSLDGGQIWSSVQGTGVTSFTLPVGSYEIGAVQVRHIDESGNASTPTTNAARIVIDQTSPTASVTTAVVKNGVADKVVVQSNEKGVAYLVKSTLTSPTTYAGITTLETNNNTSVNHVEITTANTNTDLLTTGLVDGTYNLYTVDEAGNLSTVSTNSIVVDTTAPVVTITGASFIQKNLTTENTIRLAGTDFNLLLTTGKEIFGGDINDARFDWTKLSWIVTGTTAQAITSADIAAVKVKSATELDIVLKPTNALYSNLNFLTGGTAVADTLAITAGFLKDAAGNAAVTNLGAPTSMSAVTVNTETLFKMNLLNGTNAPTIYVPNIELIAPTTQANGVDYDNATFDGTNLKATPTSVITVTGIQAGQTVTLNHLQKMSYVAGQNTINLSALATNTTTEKVVLNLIDTKGIGINNNSNVQTDMTLNGGGSYVFLGTGVDIINLVDSSPNVSPAGSLPIDSIEGFESGVDKVYLSKAIFTAFTNDVIGNMTANSKVATGATAPVGASSGKNIWINDDGTISYDADGNWSAGSVALILISTLTASDLYLV